MAELEKITMTDINQAIGKGWIANVREDEIRQNPLLASIVKGKDTEEAYSNQTTGRRRRTKGERKPVIDMFLKCPYCQHPQHNYVYDLNDKPWLKCQACGELSPSGVWSIIGIGSQGNT